jgi:hypothetical protein
MSELQELETTKDVTSFIWKGHKVLNEQDKYVQTETRLVDMNQDELSKCYEHCKTMLFNKSTQNPGRHVVLEIIADQKDRCGAELFLRFIEHEKEVSRFSLVSLINTFLNTNKDSLKNIKPVVGLIFDNVPNEFEKIPINLVVDGCLDRLRAFDKKHITRTFLLKQGIWLTPAESKELGEECGSTNIHDKLDLIRKRLNIKDVEKLYLNSRGLNYTQMRAMLTLKPNKKYRDLTTTQLEVLRNRILFSLEEVVIEHINSWESRMEEIELVAAYKNYKL